MTAFHRLGDHDVVFSVACPDGTVWDGPSRHVETDDPAEAGTWARGADHGNNCDCGQDGHVVVRRGPIFWRTV